MNEWSDEKFPVLYGIPDEEFEILLDHGFTPRKLIYQETSSVWKGNKVYNGELVAIKIISNLTREEFIIKNEISINKIIQEEKLINKLNILKFIDAFYLDVSEIERKYFIIFEYAEKETVFQLLKNNNLKLLIVFCIFNQLLSAVNELHKIGIAHRDLKNENLLITKEGYIKLADFDVAIKLSEKIENKIPSKYLTRQYASTEILQTEESEIDWMSYDIWCLGMLLYEMLKGNLPFSDNYGTVKLTSILDINGLPQDLCSIIIGCLNAQTDRILLSDILSNDFIIKSEQFLKNLQIEYPGLTQNLILSTYISENVLEIGLDIEPEITENIFADDIDKIEVADKNKLPTINLWSIMQQYLNFINS